MTEISHLVREAVDMLLDRSEQEHELIVYICKLSNEERMAIILADQIIKDSPE